MSSHDFNLDFTLNAEEPEVQTTPAATGNALPPLPKTSKRKTRSDVWNHFSKEDEMYGKCLYCDVLIKYLSGTSAMKTHLTRCKEYPPNRSNKRQRQVPPNATEGQVASSLSYSKFDQAACRLQLEKTIVSAELPFRFVENEDFQKLLNLLQPRFDIPSRSTVRRDIWALYIEEKDKLKAIFSKHCGRVCLTTDTWTSAQNLTYMSLTAHYVDCEWKLNKKIIKFCQIINFCSFSCFTDEIIFVLQKYALKTVVLTLMTEDFIVAYLLLPANIRNNFLTISLSSANCVLKKAMLQTFAKLIRTSGAEPLL